MAKSPLRVKDWICLPSSISNDTQTTKMNFEKLLGYQVVKKHDCNMAFSILFKIVHPFLLLYVLWFLYLLFMFWAVGAIFVWPENRNNKLKETERFDWFCRTDTNARGFWLVKRTLSWKNFMYEELSRNQSVLRFEVLLQHDWPIEQCLLHIKVFFGGKPKNPCFDLFIHWLTQNK